MYSKTKKTVTVGMLCALAYALTFVGRIPIVLFLKYDPKDIVIAVGGFLFGPLAAFCIALASALMQLFTNSSTGILGCLMNVVSSCAFACTAAFVYQKRHTLSGAVIGLLCGWDCMVAVMMLWNYLIAPFYLGYPREEAAKLLIPAFLPFNLIKGGINASVTMLLYKPVAAALRRSGLVQREPAGAKAHVNPGVVLASLLVLAACVWLVLVLNGVL